MMGAETAHLLDDPIWAALTTGNRHHAEGGPMAWRYPPEVAPFAAMADRSPEAFKALAAIVPAGGRLALGTLDKLVPSPILQIDMQAPLIQMILNVPVRGTPSGPEHVVLGSADVPDMIDLAERTHPGPFGPRTIEFGRYIGLRIEGTLVAMAGERMRLDRYVEISAVCVDPDHRGNGYGALLVTRLAQDLQVQGLTPFLHVFESNEGAIALYEKLGFTKRRSFYLTILRAARADT